MKMYNRDYPEPLPENAKGIIITCQSIHQEFLLCKHCPRNVGNKKWHQYWVDAYDAVLKSLEAMSPESKLKRRNKE